MLEPTMLVSFEYDLFVSDRLQLQNSPRVGSVKLIPPNQKVGLTNQFIFRSVSSLVTAMHFQRNTQIREC